MNTRDINSSLGLLFAELVDGAAEAGDMLNPKDPGLLRSLDRLSSDAASATPTGGASVAAHAEHLRYGLSLLNRWAGGENPFVDADWSASWRTTTVSDAEWERLRQGLRDEAQRWLETLRTPREVDEVELNGMIGSIAHLAYHLGAIRQLQPGTRGPQARD